VFGWRLIRESRLRELQAQAYEMGLEDRRALRRLRVRDHDLHRSEEDSSRRGDRQKQEDS
jgi:hypothetical protein